MPDTSTGRTNASPRDSRDYDLVLFGATGFTGKLTADYLAEHAPADCRWALAGRSKEKLEAVRAELAGRHPAAGDLDILVADSTDADSLRIVAESTRVVITTVGPYMQLGEPLVAACAAAGTDYVDITGEPEFVDRMFLAHHAAAEASGARIVHSCGFDSIPHDMGAFFTVQQVPDDQPITLRGVVRGSGAPSGGTFHSAVGAFSRMRQMAEAWRQRRKAETRPEGRSSKAQSAPPQRDRDLGLWLLPLPTVDPFIVARSGAALESYGPKFRYTHFMGLKRLPTAVGMAVGTGGLVAAAQVPPLRRQLLKRMPQGEGPSPEDRAKAWFSVDFIGDAGGRPIHTKVSGQDPGYGGTAIMLAESALCLAYDDLPKTAGQVTTAQAMGQPLLDRLIASGMKFEVL